MSFSHQRKQSSTVQSAGRFLPWVEELEKRVLPALLGQSLFPADYPTNNSIANAPVSASSAAWIAAMNSSRSHLIVNWGAYTPGSGGPLYSMPYNVVHSKDTVNYTNVKVYIDNYPNESDLSGTDASQGNRPYVLVPMPKVNPQNLFIEGDNQNGPNPSRFTSGGADSHLLVWDADTNTAYEFWESSRPNESSVVPNGYYIKTAIANQWNAANEATWTMTADMFRTLGYTSGDAAGLPILANIVRPDEVLTSADGGQSAIPAITHALRFTLTAGLISKQFAYPASHVAAGGGGIPYGTRFRLLNNAAVNALIAQMGPESQVIAHALQTYGLILADIGSSMFVQGAATSVDTNNNPIIDPLTGKPITWDMNDLTPDAVSGKYTVGLDSLPTTDFVAVDLTPQVISLSALSGPAGTTITITGANFTGSAGHLSVLFVPPGNNPPYTSTPAYPNGQTTTLNAGVVKATTFTILDDQHIQVVVPGGLSGTVDIQVLSGQLLDDTYNSDAENATAPIFGYGISAQNSGDKFTYNASGISVSPASLPNWTVNQGNYSSTVSANGGTGPYTFAVSAGTLPTGLSFNTSSGAITGTPTATGTFTFTIKATDTKSATGSQAYSVLINPAVSVTTTALPAWTVSKSGYNSSFATNGGTGSISFAITLGALPTGLSLNASTGAITGTPTATGTFNFTVTATDSVGATGTNALSILINPVVSISTTSLPSWTVSKSGYSSSVAATGGTGGFTFSITVGSLPTGLSLNASTGAITGTPTATGTFNFTVTAKDSVGATGTKALSIAINSAVSISTTALPNWTVNKSGYNSSVAASGGTGGVTFSISAGSLPTGLSLNASTGAITGAPTATGTFNFTIKATDTVGATGTKALSIVINPVVSITTTTLPNPHLNSSYNQTIAITGGTGPFTFGVSAGSLPTGLSLNTSTGAITGTPTVLGPFSFTITVTDSLGSAANHAYNVVVSNVSVTPSTLPNWTVNVAGYSQTLSASGGTAPYTFAVTAGSLPTGLALNATSGAITGTPTATGSFAFTITATDKVNATSVSSYAVTINAVPTITTSNLASGTANQAGYSQVLMTSGGTGPLVFGLTAGQLPPGLSLNFSTGVISGTPTTSGTFHFTITITDALGVATNTAQTIVINAASVAASPPPPSTKGLPPTVIATGADSGGGPQITVYDASTASVATTFYGLPPNFTGGARVAMGDVNGDGVLDYVVAAGPGAAPQITVLDGTTQQPIRGFYALPQSFTGGAYVACGDVNGDGFADIIVSADKGGGPQVTIWSGKDGSLLASFYATTPTFTGGIRIASADINGDGFADVIAVAGPGGGPQVTVFDGQTQSVIDTFYAVAPSFAGGLFVAAGDVNGDRKADIVVGADAGGGPQVTLFDGPTLALIKSFYALAPSFKGGVRVGVAEVNGSEAIVAAAGPGGGPQVAMFDSATLALLDSFYATTPSFTGGLFVA